MKACFGKSVWDVEDEIIVMFQELKGKHLDYSSEGGFGNKALDFLKDVIFP